MIKFSLKSLLKPKYLLILFLVLIFIFLLSLRSQSPSIVPEQSIENSQNIKLNPSFRPTATDLSKPISQNSGFKADQINYFHNKINSLSPVTGYSWLENILIYSTPTGIYQASDNKPLVKTPIDYISFSAQGQAIYQSNNKWFFFSAPDVNDSLSFSGNYPTISPSGQYLIAKNQDQLSLKSLFENSDRLKNLPEPINSIFWSSSSDYLAVATEKNIYILDLNLDIMATLDLKQFGRLLGISPNAQELVLSYPGTIEILNTLNEGASRSIQFDLKSDLSVFFLGQDLLVTETLAPDFMNRRLTSLWLISNQEKISVLNDASIPNRLNLKEALYANPQNTILPLIENNSVVWILSLKPNLFPSLTDQGFSFYPLSDQSHED